MDSQIPGQPRAFRGGAGGGGRPTGRQQTPCLLRRASGLTFPPREDGPGALWGSLRRARTSSRGRHLLSPSPLRGSPSNTVTVVLRVSAHEFWESLLEFFVLFVDLGGPCWKPLCVLEALACVAVLLWPGDAALRGGRQVGSSHSLSGREPVIFCVILNVSSPRLERLSEGSRD